MMTIGIMRSFLTLGKKAFIDDISRSFHVWLSRQWDHSHEPSFARCHACDKLSRYTLRTPEKRDKRADTIKKRIIHFDSSLQSKWMWKWNIIDPENYSLLPNALRCRKSQKETKRKEEQHGKLRLRCAEVDKSRYQPRNSDAIIPNRFGRNKRSTILQEK